MQLQGNYLGVLGRPADRRQDTVLQGMELCVPPSRRWMEAARGLLSSRMQGFSTASIQLIGQWKKCAGQVCSPSGSQFSRLAERVMSSSTISWGRSSSNRMA